MRYSFIIPTLNEEALLPKLLGQLNDAKPREKYKFEIIISDGGSTDNTLTIAKKFADKIITKEDTALQNIAEGRNIGAASASGDIFIFLNGDVLFKDPLEFFDFLENYFVPSEYLAFTCYVWIYPEESKFTDKFFHTIYNTYFFLLNYFGIGMGRGECQVIRREVFEQVGGYNNQCAAGEDFELYKRIRKLGKIFYSKNIYVFESPRRFRKFGYLRVSFSWFLNSISVIFRKKSLYTKWEQIR